MDLDQPPSPNAEQQQQQQQQQQPPTFPRPRRRSTVGSRPDNNNNNNVNNNEELFHFGSSANNNPPRRRSTVDSMPMSLGSVESPSNHSSMSNSTHNMNMRERVSALSSARRSSLSGSGSSGFGDNPLFRPPLRTESEPITTRNRNDSDNNNSSAAVSNNNNIDNTTHSSPSPASSRGRGGPIRRTTMSDLEQVERRASIKQILQDGRLSQLEKRRSIQFLMDGRSSSTTIGNRRSTLDGSCSLNPYLQAKAAEAAKEHREKILRRSSSNGNLFTNGGGGGENGNEELPQLESTDSLRDSLRNTTNNNYINGGGSTSSGIGGSGVVGGGDNNNNNMDRMEESYRRGSSIMGSSIHDFESSGDDMDISKRDPSEHGGSMNGSGIGNGGEGADGGGESAASAAVAAWRRYHGESKQEEEDLDTKQGQEHIEIPNHSPLAAAAIAHASSQTTSDILAAKHPYNARTTAVPAIAASAYDVHPYNKKKSAVSLSPLEEEKQKKRLAQLNRRAIDTAPPCTHYQRNCHIVSPCCGATFGCRICHDDCPVLPPLLVNQGLINPMMMDMGGSNSGGGLGGRKYQRVLRTSSMPSSFEASLGPPEHHNVDRFAIKEVICRECFTKQSSKTNFCVNCNIQLGEYHCAICNLWMSNEEHPYHCPDCGFCRVGGGENFRHCQDCGMCIDKQLFAGHNCKVGKYMSNCPVCQEDLFSSRDASHELPCGHAIHWHCFRELASHDSRCPMCKKTAETHERMKPTWDAMAMGIALQPVPPELCKVVTIKCNDCEKVAQNRSWHFLGVQCQGCESFNTVVEKITMMGQEAHEFLLRQDPAAAAATAAAAPNSNNADGGSGAAGGAQGQDPGSSSSGSPRQRPRRRRASMAAVPGEHAPPPFSRR